ncbi:MAG TPA: hypothetical protein VKB72_12600 [Steroidobacteraceae bacterium]|nr:hypothetical protein [Steroidobacteraceae bacterium]
MNNKTKTKTWGLCPQLAVITVLAFASGPAFPVDSASFVETDELRIVYYPYELSLVPHATQSFLSALAAHRRVWGYVPNDGVTVFLRDWQDYGNATTYWAPHNLITVEVAPSYDPYESLSSADRVEAEAMHELAHAATTDRASPEDYRWRHFFHGKVAVDSAHPETVLYNYLTAPRGISPRWYLEGSAVFMETWMTGGVGRAQGGYDEMVFRAMVQDSAKFYDPLGLVSKGTEIDFQTGANAYLYGTRFMDYLALTYGPERLLAWWRRDAGSRRYYADQFQQVFGLPLKESWHRWIDFEHDFQRKNLQSVHEHPLTEFHDITHKDLGGVSRGYLSKDGSKEYMAVKYPGQVAHLVALSRRDGHVTQLAEIKGARGYTVTSLAFDPQSETLFFTSNNSTSYRNLEALDLHSGKTRMLLRAWRVGDIVFNPADRSLWGLRFDNGRDVLVRIPPPYNTWYRLYTFGPDEQAFDLDLSPDGTLASVSVSGRGPRVGAPYVTQVRVIRTDALVHGDATPLHTFTMGSAVPEGFVFSPDGRYLFGSSYYTGVSNIYRYELATEKLDAVSNAALGFFRPLPLDDSRLIVLRYSAKGFVPTQIEAQPTEDLSAVTFLGEQVAEKYPTVQSWVAQVPSTIPYESQIVRQGPYRPARQLEFDSVIPVIKGYFDSVSLGANARFSDPIGFAWLNVDTTYSPDDSLPSKERLHAMVTAHIPEWTAGAAWNRDDFYDLFGPTKRSLAGYNGYVSYDHFFIYDPPQTMDVTAKVAYYGDLVTLPGFQNVLSPTSNLLTADVGLTSVDTRRSPGAVDDETGHTWSLKAHTYSAPGEFIPSIRGTFDLGFPLPLDHSSIWLRSGAAVSAGARDNPLSNFYLGGFGNNWVDSGANGSAQRYRELLSMPGFEIDALQGKSLVKAMLEWCIPPARFEALGSPGFYVSWMRPELFATALETDFNNATFRQQAYNVGGQLDFKLQVMHRWPMMLSVGVAEGFGGGGFAKTEFMASLQVL